MEVKMKRAVFQKCVLILFHLFLFSSAQSQKHPALESFTAHKIDDAVLLNWVISGGNTCNGVSIQRAEEGFNFQDVGHIPGVCGDAEFDIPYQFLDDNINSSGLFKYRLELGQLGLTEALELYFYNFEERNFIHIRLASQSKIIFDLPDSEEFVFSLYSLNGNLIHSKLSRGSNPIDLPRHLSAGIYILSAVSGTITIYEKIFIEN